MKQYSVTFDDTAEGRVRLFENQMHTDDKRFISYGQALDVIEMLRGNGWRPLNANADAIEALLRTAEKYEQKVMGEE